MVSVGDTVIVDEQLVLHGFLVYFAKPGGAEEAVLLVIEKHKGSFRHLFRSEHAHKLAKSDNTGGVVVDSVFVWLSAEH